MVWPLIHVTFSPLLFHLLYGISGHIIYIFIVLDLNFFFMSSSFGIIFKIALSYPGDYINYSCVCVGGALFPHLFHQPALNSLDCSKAQLVTWVLL